MQELQRLRLTDDTDLIVKNRELKAKLDKRTEKLLVQNDEVIRLQAELLALTREYNRLIMLNERDSDETKRKV